MVILAGLGALLAYAAAEPAPAEVDTTLFGTPGKVLREDPPVVGFEERALPKGFDGAGLGRAAPLLPLEQPVESSREIAAQAHGTTFLLGQHAGVPLHVFRLQVGGWLDRLQGRPPVQEGVCFDAGAYGFCTTAEQLRMIDDTRVWGPSGQDPGPGRRIGIWVPVPDRAELVVLQVDGRPVAWQQPVGPAAVLVFDELGRAEMVAYDAEGSVIETVSGR